MNIKNNENFFFFQHAPILPYGSATGRGDACHAHDTLVSSRQDYCNGLIGGALKYIFSVSCLVSWGPRRTPHPRTSSEKPHGRRDLHETALVRHFRTSRLQTLCAGFPVPARVFTSLSCRLFDPGWCKWKTVKSPISGYRTSCVFRAPRLWQSAHGHLLLALRLHAWNNLSVDLSWS